MLPILGLQEAAANALNQPIQIEPDDSNTTSSAAVGTPTMTIKHHSSLLDLLASELSIEVSQIQDFELSLYDTQPASIGGINNEFIHSPRLDNQMSCFCSTEALIESLKEGNGESLKESKNIRAIALFDNEEVGSVSTHGAESNMLASTVKRLASIQIKNGVELKNDEHRNFTAFERSISKSFLIS